jgi:CRISPR/Cas system-associated exonuclease Cas4 (RecB family)
MVLMPIETPSDDIHVSASSVRSIIDGCPRETYYRKILGLPSQDKSSGLVLGSATHEALALFYLTLQQSKREATLQEMVDVAHASIDGVSDIHYKSGEDSDSLKAMGTQLIEAFLQQGYRPRGKILAIEKRFSIALHNPYTGEILPERLIGYFDLVTEENGLITIIDHKTAARLEKNKGQGQDIQMALYQHAGKELFGTDRIELAFQTLVKTKQPSVIVQPLVKQDVESAMETVFSAITHLNLAVGMDKPEVMMYRRPSWKCWGCGFRGRC